MNNQNMHFVSRHELKPPGPRPSAWLGVPLQTANKPIGALVVQRYPPSPSFNRWSREVLLVVAGQASAAVQNAGLYQETVCLYNLTDEALAQRVKQLQALLDTMQEGVLMPDSEGHIVLVNTEAALLLGHSAAELRWQVLDVDLAAAKLGYEGGDLEQMLELLKNGKIPESARFTFEARLPDDNGRSGRRFVERTGEPVLTASKQIIGWLMLFRDVAEERELTEQHSDLTRMIVHDLQNPVSTFISNMHRVDTLLPAGAGMEAAREAVADARQSGYDMLDMVDSLMDINRMEAGLLVAEVEAVNLQALVERVVRRMKVVADQRQIVLSQHVEPELPLVWADEDMIRRVLINLLDNALKYTPSGGYVDWRFAHVEAISGW